MSIFYWFYDLIWGVSIEDETYDLIANCKRAIDKLEFKIMMLDDVHTDLRKQRVDFYTDQILIREKIISNLEIALETKSTHKILQAQTKALSMLNSFENTRDNPERERQEAKLEVYVDELKQIAPNVSQVSLPEAPIHTPNNSRISTDDVKHVTQHTPA